MLLTLFADASFCSETKASGWGAWAKAEAWLSGMTFGGPNDFWLTTPHEAELWAIALALDHLHRKGHLEDVTVLVLQSDCLRALQAIWNMVPQALAHNHRNAAPIPTGRIRLSRDEKGASFSIRNIVSGKKVYLRHVRGHKHGDGRQWVNRQCDMIAREYMLERRAKLLSKPRN